MVPLAIVEATTVLLGADKITLSGDAIELSLLPSPVDTVFTLVGVPLLLAVIVVVLATLAYATVKGGRDLEG